LEVLETQNTELQGKLSTLENSISRRSGGDIEAEQTSGEGTLGTLIQRLGVLESAQGGFDLVQMGGYHFGGPGDCKAFLRAEAPKASWGAYDMVSLLHRASVDASTTACILSRDCNAKKSLFPNIGSVFIYTLPCSSRCQLLLEGQEWQRLRKTQLCRCCEPLRVGTRGMDKEE
jgi:hypothetical protein